MAGPSEKIGDNPGRSGALTAMVSMVLMKRSNPHAAGFSLVEVMIGSMVAMIGIGAVMFLNSASLRYVRSARQSNAATLFLQERIEQVRIADWRRITSADYLKNTLFATLPKSAGALAGSSEQVSVVAYPSETAAEKLLVVRQSNGQRSTVSGGSGLTLQRLAKVDLQVSWKGEDGRNRVRTTTALIANGGISRMNLPAFGNVGGSPSSSDPSTPTPAPSTSPSATPTATATPTPAPTSPGNGNGRGNVSGKSGKN